MTTTQTNIHPARLLVCPLSAVEDQVSRSGARHLVTCINAQTMIETPAGIPSEQHLKLAMNDISVPQSGLVSPSSEHVDSLISFAQDWQQDAPMVVHCWAGISRSSAAAFIMLCALNSTVDEAVIARAIRAASPTAYPNRLMVQIGDQLLQRAGRMVDAVSAIGRGEMALEGIPFSLSADQTKDLKQN